MQGDDGTTPPPPDDEEANILQDYDDVAASIGANVQSGELAAMVDSVGMAYGRLPADFIENPPGVLIGTRNGLQLKYKFYCRDAAEAPLPCNGFEDHEHVHVSWTGTISSATAAVDGLTRDGNWIVRDVVTPTPRAGGHGTTAFNASMATGTYAFSFSDEFASVRFDALAPALPTAGTMDLMLTIHRTRDVVGDRDFTATAHVEFVGPDAATISLDGVHTYDLTLSTGAVVRVN